MSAPVPLTTSFQPASEAVAGAVLCNSTHSRVGLTGVPLQATSLMTTVSVLGAAGETAAVFCARGVPVMGRPAASTAGAAGSAAVSQLPGALGSPASTRSMLARKGVLLPASQRAVLELAASMGAFTTGVVSGAVEEINRTAPPSLANTSGLPARSAYASVGVKPNWRAKASRSLATQTRSPGARTRCGKARRRLPASASCQPDPRVIGSAEAFVTCTASSSVPS